MPRPSPPTSAQSLPPIRDLFARSLRQTQGIGRGLPPVYRGRQTAAMFLSRFARISASRKSAAGSSRIAVGLAVLTTLLLGGATACKKDAPPPAAAAPTAGSTAKAATPPPEAVGKVLGRWLRSDGGYVLELKGADISGVMQAAYFNPKPINVSRAIWMQGAAGFQIVVELNDVGYPGATYVLSHQASSDRLIGQYNQPAMQQSFDVEFVRQPKP